MGWYGHYMRFCPKGSQRVLEATQGYTWEDEHRKVTLLDAVLVSTTVYAAVEVITKATGKRDVRASVILTAYDKRDHEFMTKHIGEESGPTQRKCPKRILDKLTPIDSEWANEWREACRQYNQKKLESSKKSAGNLPEGTIIRLNNPAGNLMKAYKNPYTGRLEFYGGNRKASVRCVNSWGYEIVEEAKKNEE